MKKMMIGTIFLCCFAFAACGSDSDAESNASNNKGSTNNGTSNENNGTSKGNNGTTNANNGTSKGNNGTSIGNNGTTNANNGTTNSGLTIGSDCAITDNCNGGFCEYTSDPCDGTCVAYAAVGQDCNTTSKRCDSVITKCDFDDSNTCVAKPDKGEACKAAECVFGLFCDVTDDAALTDGVCADMIGLDGACPEGIGCDFDFYCDDSFVCKAKSIKENETCTDATADQCVRGTFCDSVDMKCVASSLGVTCN